jgi:L-asparaginase
LTGSQRPISSVRSDARGNLINSIELATHEIPEVGICFGNQLFRGNRTKKMSIESYQGFESPNYQPLAKIGLNIQLFEQYFWQQERKYYLKPLFDTQFAVIPVYPGLNPESYQSIIDSGIRSIILEAYGAGNLPVDNPNWIPFIEKIKNAGKSVFVISQSAHGAVDLDLYLCGRKASEVGAVSLADMTLESAIVKLMILQANEKSQLIIEQRMRQSIAGEIKDLQE